MLSKSKIEVGTEVDAMCTPCKGVTIHVISAVKDGKIAKVMCKACQATHRYRPAFEETAAPSAVKKTKDKAQDKVRRAAKTRQMKKWNNLLGEADTENPRDYEVSKSYEQQQVIQHSHFGLGVVVKVVDDNKMDVAFEEGVKTLVMNI
ncbi:hypothetical protein JW992_01725 [candidate division KSB1 bacterium]|nr:hypothetical protein [candidate division KSB1 bacterium]